VFILDSLLIGSIRFVLEKVVAAAEAEMDDDTALREQLLEAQMRLELGEISPRQFARIERDILARIKKIKGSRRQGAISLSNTSSDDQAATVEIEAWK
jgi:hypothetical protein